MRWVASATPRLLYSQERGRVHTVNGAGRVSEPVSTSMKKFALPGFESRTVQPIASL